MKVVRGAGSRLVTSIVVAIAMVAGSGLAVAMKPTRHLAEERARLDLETAIPTVFGEWELDRSVVPVVPAPDVVRKLDEIYSQTLARTYFNKAGDRVMLSLAYGGSQADSLQVHKPEVCYAAQGFRVLDVSDGQMSVGGATLPVRRLVGQLGGRIEPITYWVVIGEAVPKMEERKFVQLGYGLRGVVPDGMLVRISSISRDREAAYQMQEQFAWALQAALSNDVRVRLFGVNPGANDARR